MDDRVLQTITHTDGKERVIIVQRPDGRYSYRKQWRLEQSAPLPAGPICKSDAATTEGWGPPGPYAGIYDSEETAKWEALGKVDWLSSTFNSN